MPSLSDITSGLAAKVGYTRKALLCIKNSDGSSGSAIDIAKAMNEISATELWASNEKFKEQYKNDYYIFEVQYNPSTIGLSCASGDLEFKVGPGDAGESNIRRRKMSSNIYFDVDLIFEKIVAGDSYKTPGSATDMVKTGVNMLLKKKYSVQAQVEGILSLLTKHSSRMVIFHWEKMTFVGELNNINVTYNMFSDKGRPVSANVHIKLIDRAMSENTGTAESAEYWDEAFNNLFGSSEASTLVSMSRNTDSMSGMVNNLLGL